MEKLREKLMIVLWTTLSMLQAVVKTVVNGEICKRGDQLIELTS